jgi:chorismate mutase
MVAVQNLKGEIIQLISSTNKTDCHNIIEILLKVALNTIKPTNIFGRSSGQFDKVSFFGMPTKY